ncbi:MAG: hypothetical protein ACRBFS_02650 [Aureispira sp.]
MRALTPLASLVIGLALLLTACQDTIAPPPQLGLIEPPIPELAPAYQDFAINAQEESVFTLASGTVVTVPANALIDATGQLVKGQATIKYREYHDATSVVLSGIPMDYSSNKQKHHFQTAGMFDIVGEQTGKPLSIKAGSGIRVDLASFEEESNYNLFALHQEKGWQFVDYVPPTPNLQRQVLDQKIKSLSKKIGRTVSPYFVFNYDGILDVSFKENPLSAQHRANSKLRKKFKAYSIDAYKSSIYRYVPYEDTNYPADMLIWRNVGKRFPSWARYKQCALSLELLKGKTYKITAQYQGKKFEGKISMVVPLKYLFDYTPNRWKNERATILKDISSKEEKYREELEQLRLRKEQQAEVIRSFTIAGFGVYNYDRLMKASDKIEILANFDVPTVKQLDWVLCLPEDGKTVIKYPLKDWEKVVLLPNNKARFVSILPDKRVAVYSAEAYQALDFETLSQSQERPKVDFKLEMVVEELESEDALRVLINS